MGDHSLNIAKIKKAIKKGDELIRGFEKNKQLTNPRLLTLIQHFKETVAELGYALYNTLKQRDTNPRIAKVLTEFETTVAEWKRTRPVPDGAGGSLDGYSLHGRSARATEKGDPIERQVAQRAAPCAHIQSERASLLQETTRIKLETFDHSTPRRLNDNEDNHIGSIQNAYKILARELKQSNERSNETAHTYMPYRYLVDNYCKHDPIAWKQEQIALNKFKLHKPYNRLIWHQTARAVVNGWYMDKEGEVVNLRRRIGTLGTSVRFRQVQDGKRAEHSVQEESNRIAVIVEKKNMMVLARELAAAAKEGATGGTRGKLPLLLNMAAAGKPGGGVRWGHGAQEESLFRSSNYFEVYNYVSRIHQT